LKFIFGAAVFVKGRATDETAAGAMTFEIEELKREHWEQARAIYLEGLATGLATFETEAPGWETWDAAHLTFARLVARSNDEGGEVLGWAALSPVSRRRVYEGVAEVSVYVAQHVRGGGVGGALLRALVKESERNGVWTLQAGIFPENVASLSLHARCGFREVGRRERIGKLGGRWRDTLLLERRSERVGID
jgi:L-amino acid N-acyltransferase YncA